ncbi:MAG TPA: hypothetical protein VI112_13470 [Bacteroidia bacterium]|jgi:RimJ/RimL family protein N-acetyltransferase
MYNHSLLDPHSFPETRWKEFYALSLRFSNEFEEALAPDLSSFIKDRTQRITTQDLSINLLMKDDKMIGYTRYWIINKGKPSQNNSVHCYVPDEYFFEGLEKLIAAALLERMAAHGHEKCLWRVMQPAMKGIAEKLKGRLSNSGSWFRLDPHSVKKELLQSWLNNPIVEIEGLTIKWVEFIPEHLLDEVAIVSNVMVNDMPRQDRSIPFHVDAQYLRNAQENTRGSGQKPLHLFLRNKNNELIGISMVLMQENSPAADQRITGVMLPWRGKGLAKWMKAKMLEKLLDEYPHITNVKTECFSANLPMININKAMGYEMYRSDHDYFLDREELQKAST